MVEEVKDLSYDQLYDIANLAVNYMFDSKHTIDIKEVDAGGYDKRRRIIWKEVYDGEFGEVGAFEISTNQYGSWRFFVVKSEREIDYEKESHWTGTGIYRIACYNVPEIIDYCDENGINIRNDVNKTRSIIRKRKIEQI